MWILYQLVVTLTLLVAGPVLILLRARHYLSSLPGRLSLAAGEAQSASLWIHAVSVGEVGVARTLLSALPRETAVVLSTITPTGQEQARAIDRERFQTAYLPFELGWPIRRFLERYSPRALVLCEGDYWPLLLRHVKRRRLPVAVINGRVSDKSFRRLRRARTLLRPLLDPVDAFGMQTEEDRLRLIDLGVAAERVRVTGNMKFDAETPQRHRDLEERLSTLASGRPILIAGSTMAGEEAAVLAAFRGAGGGERAMLVLAPRHPERWESVAEAVAADGLNLARRSALDRAAEADVVLLDSMGELAGLYAVCLSALIGGTLVPTGGHNPLEPARYGVAVTAGPSMENFRAMADEFDRAEAWRRVEDADALSAAWSEWLDDPRAARRVGERAAALVERNRGALDRTLELLTPLLRGPVDPEAGGG